jgi:hypothetical protein
MPNACVANVSATEATESKEIHIIPFSVASVRSVAENVGLLANPRRECDPTLQIAARGDALQIGAHAH